MNPALVVTGAVLGVLWVGSIAVLLRNSSLETRWLRWLDAVLLLPAIIALVVANLAVAWQLVPSLFSLIERLRDEVGSKAAAPIALVLTAPLPIAFCMLWRFGLHRLEKRLGTASVGHS